MRARDTASIPDSKTPAARDATQHRTGDRAFSPAGNGLTTEASRVNPAMRPADILRLQRQFGNRYAQQVVALLRACDGIQVQRQAAPATTAPPTGTDEDPVARAVRTGDPLDITAIQDFSKVSEPDRLRFIRILNAETSEAISKGHVIKLWQSFGADRFGAVVMANQDIWGASVTVFGGDPLVLIPAGIANQYSGMLEGDLKALAGDNLKQNEQMVDQRMQQLGLKSGPQAQFSAEEATKLRHAVQQIAWDVWSMRQSQKKLEQTPIGLQLSKSLKWGLLPILMGHEEEPVLFNPRTPPKDATMLQSWQPLKEEWDRAQKGITDAAGSYPEIYELVVEDEEDKLLQLSRVTPEGFAAQQGQLLQALIDRIKNVEGMVNDGQLDLLALQPALARLTSGGKWAAGFEHYMAGVLLEQHRNHVEALNTIATIIKFVPLLLAPIASTGIGSILEAVAIGASVAIASAEYKQASAQAEAARATPIAGTELLDRATADAAKAKALSELVDASVLAIIAAIAGGVAGAAKLADLIQMGRLRAVLKDEALITRLVQKIPDKGQLYKIASKAGDVSKLEDLVRAVPDPARLDALLSRAGDAPRLAKLLEKVPDVGRLGKLLDAAEGTRLQAMFDRLGSVEEVEKALASQAQGQAEGLLDTGSMTRMAKGAHSLAGEWSQLTPQQRLDKALAEFNAELQVQGVPPIRARLVEDPASAGKWAAYDWSASVSADLAADSGSAQKLSMTLYHEGRHAEQDFLVARLRASEGKSAEELAYPRSEGGLGLKPEIAQEAAVRKLPADSPQGKLAKDMAKAGDTFKGSAYSKIIDKRYDAMVARDEAKFEELNAKSEALHSTGDYDAMTPHLKQAKAKLREAEAAFDIADKAYKGVPFEKDAFAVEAEFEKHLAAATAK